MKPDDLMDAFYALLEAFRASRKDALRYQWLRKQIANGHEADIGEGIYSEEELDRYIDAKR